MAITYRQIGRLLALWLVAAGQALLGQHGAFAQDKAPPAQAIEQHVQPANGAKAGTDSPGAQQLFEAFLKDTTTENFLRVRKAVISDPAYNPYSLDLKEASELLGKGRVREAQSRLDKAGTNLLLSPSAYPWPHSSPPGWASRPRQKGSMRGQGNASWASSAQAMAAKGVPTW